VAPNDEEVVDACLARQAVPGLHLDQELVLLIKEIRTKRNRPGLTRNATEQGEVMLKKFKKTWENLVEEM
jgi:hypothetical protein